MLSRLVINFSFKEQASFNFMCAVILQSASICNDFGAQENKSVTVSIVSPSICHEVKGLSSQGYGFSSGHVWTSELDCEES